MPDVSEVEAHRIEGRPLVNVPVIRCVLQGTNIHRLFYGTGASRPGLMEWVTVTKNANILFSSYFTDIEFYSGMYTVDT